MEEEPIVVEPEAPPPEVSEPDPAEPDPPVDFGGLLKAERATSQSLRERLTAAAISYRTAVLATAPDVPPELVSGQTPEEIDASLEAARGIVAAVRERSPNPDVAQPPPAVSVPSGAPVRTEPDLAGMSAIDKIKYALTRS